MHKITKITVLEDYRIEITFADNTCGIVDLSQLAGHGVFSLWNDKEVFRQVKIGQHGELVWPGDIDLCPDSLYMKVTGKKPEDVFPTLKHEKTYA
ncbi:MAG: DUF2442 domain-containing protein [Candidatus Hydrogenedentota bacterium]